MREKVNTYIAQGHRNIAIDLSALEFLYSDAMNMFFALNRQILDVSGRITLLSPTDEVRSVLDSAGIFNFLKVYPTEAELLRSSEDIIMQTSSFSLAALRQYQEASQAAQQQEQKPESEFDDLRSEIASAMNTDAPAEQQTQASPPPPPPPPPPPQEPVQQQQQQQQQPAAPPPPPPPAEEEISFDLGTPSAPKNRESEYPPATPTPQDTGQFQQQAPPPPPPPPDAKLETLAPQQSQGMGAPPAGPQFEPQKPPTRFDRWEEEEKQDEKKGSPIVPIVIAVVVILALGAAGFFFLFPKLTQQQTPEVVQTPPPPPPPAPKPDTTEAVDEAQVEEESTEPPQAVTRAAAPRRSTPPDRPRPRRTTPKPSRRVSKPKPKPAPTPPKPARTSVTKTNRMVFKSAPGGATIIVDGKKRGTTPFTWNKPDVYGTMKVTISKAGYKDLTKYIEFSGGSEQHSFKLEKKPAQPKPVATPASQPEPSTPPSAPPGKSEPAKPAAATPAPTATASAGEPATIFISSIPPVADVYMDGKLIGKTNIAKLKVLSGTHTLKFVKAGKEHTVEMKFQPGENPSKLVNLNR
ncbi:MAG: PEGA domain-containing protein [Chitinivibrionales bacterium]|nr:PEGA domain-containing protein [Chitinivibrionales bacterium]